MSAAQAKPGPSCDAQRAGRAIVALEDARQVFLCNPEPLVADLEDPHTESRIHQRLEPGRLGFEARTLPAIANWLVEHVSSARRSGASAVIERSPHAHEPYAGMPLVVDDHTLSGR